MNQIGFLLFWFLFFSFRQTHAEQCSQIGCKICENSLCTKCDTGFILNEQTSICQYSLCEAFQSYQPSQNECISLCNETTNPNLSTHTCEISNSCPTSFVQVTGINKQSSIKYIVDYSENILLLIYQNFINTVDKINGSFQRQFTFDTSVIAIYPYPKQQFKFSQTSTQKVYLLTENSVIEWDPIQNTLAQEIKFSQSQIKSDSSMFIPVSNNLTRFVISTFVTQKLIMLTEIKTGENITSFNLSEDQTIYSSDFSILIYNSSTYEILIYQIFENQTTFELSITSEFQKELIGPQPISTTNILQLIPLDNFYFLIVQNISGIFLMSRINQTSSFKQMSSNPLKIVPFEISINFLSSLFLGVSFSDNSIQIFQPNSLNQLFQFSPTQTFIDFNIPNSESDKIIIFILSSSTKQLISYSFKISDTPFTFSQTMSKITNILISSPSKLVYLPGVGISSQPSIAIVYQDLQLVSTSTSNTQMVIKDFSDKLFQNEASISAIALSENLSFILSCAVDGQLIVWSAIDAMNPVYMYKISQTGQKCRDVQVFKSQYAVVLYTSLISIVDIINPYNSQTIQILNTASLSQIQISSDYIFILKDSTLLLSKGINQIIFDFQMNGIVLNNVSHFSIIDSIRFIIIKNSLVIEQYSMLFENTFQASLINSYNAPYEILSFKIFLIDLNSKTILFFIDSQKQFFQLSICTGFVIMLNDKQHRVVKLDETLVECFSSIKEDGEILFFEHFDEDKVFFVMKMADTSLIYRYRNIYLDMSNQFEFVFAYHISKVSISQFEKRPNVLGKLGYSIILILPLGYTSLNIEIRWEPPSSLAMIGGFQYTPAQNIVTTVSNNLQSQTYVGTASGEVRISPLNKTTYVKKIASAASSATYDTIIKIIPNFNLGRLFVISNSIAIYNLFTNDFMEIISFSPNTDFTQSVKKIFSAQITKIIIACISQEILVKDFQTGNTYRLSTITPPFGFQMTFINGFYYDETTMVIYIFGDGLYSADMPNLVNFKLISSFIFQTCLFTTSTLICRINSSQIIFFDRTKSISLIQIVNMPTNMGSFSIAVDIEYGYLFAYSNIFQIYSIKGALVSTTTYSVQIISVSFYGSNILLLSSSIAYIYSRSLVTYYTSISPPGGNFKEGIYISEYKIFAYYCDDTRFGQVFFYSLDTYMQIGSITNTYTGNGVGQVIGLFYDSDSAMLNYLDRYGNNQNVIFSGQRTTDNLVYVEEIQALDTAAPIGQSIDFNTNNIYIYNGDYVWTFNYNLLTRPIQRLLKKRPNFVAKLSDSYLIVDYSNTIFSYKNMKLSYSSDFSSPVLHLQTLPTSQLLLIVFSNKIFIYSNTLQIFTETNNQSVLSSYYLSSFLLIEKDMFNPIFDRTIISTYSNRMVDYDFLSQKELGWFFLESEDLISAKLSYRTQDDWYFLFGTNTGKYGLYNLKTRQSFIYFPSLDQTYSCVLLLKAHPTLPSSAILIYKSGKVLILKLQSSGISLSTNTQLQDLIYSIAHDILPISTFDFNLSLRRIYLNFNSQKVLYIFHLDYLTLMTHVSFPDDQWKRMDENSYYLVLSSAAQANIYNTDNLALIGRVRRYNRKDRITDIRLLDPNIIILVFTTRIEVLLIQSNSVVLIETISSVTDPRLIQDSISIQNYNLHLIGVSKTALFEKSISLILYNNAYVLSLSASNTTNALSCFASFSYTDNGSAQNSLDQISSTSILMTNLNFFLQIHVSKELNNLTFLSRSSTQTIIRPTAGTDNVLNLKSNSFLNLPFNVFLDSFKFVFVENGSPIMFHSKSINVTLQNIDIFDQFIKLGTQLVFSNKQVVLIQKMALNSIKFSETRNRLLTTTTTNDTAFLMFLNCQYVLIDELSIVSSELLDIFLSSSQTTKFIIKSLKLQDSKFIGFSSFIQDTNVIITNVQITNCTSYQIYNSPLFNFIGVLLINISNLGFRNNDQIILIETNKNYEEENTSISLKIDQILLSNVMIEDNTFANSFNKDTQQNLIYFQSSFIKLNNLQYRRNEGNIKVQNANSFELKESEFDSNIGVNGSCIWLKQITNYLLIDSSKFNGNIAYASGGALYLFDTLPPLITQKCTFSRNVGMIGGAIRIQSQSILLIDTSQIQAIFQENKAEMFGSDIGTYLNKFQLYQSDSSISDASIIMVQEGNIFSETNESVIQLVSVQSGGNLQLIIQLFDQNDKIFTFDTKKYLNQEYSSFIIEEIDSYQINFYQVYSSSRSNNLDSLLEIKGESILSSKQYDETLKSYCFTSMTTSSQPLNTVQVARIKLSFNQYIPSSGKIVSISYRDCKNGEIYEQSSTQDVIVCSACLDGTYSQRTSNFDILSLEEKLDQFNTCKTCPFSASKCSGNSIVLKTGYWRINNTSDIIIECTEETKEVCDEANPLSREGCLGGHIGPLCEQCDITQRVWGEYRYGSSFNKKTCNQCSSVFIQILFIIFGMLGIFLYLFMNVIWFMNSYRQNSICVYLRLMKIVPLSTSSVLDQSTYFIKSLMNYFQLSAQLFTFTVPFIPSSLALFPTVAGQPASQVIISYSCVYSIDDLTKYGDERLRAISQAFYPLGIFLMIFLVLKACEHKKILEPDSIAFFTKALSCRSVGGVRYEAINLTIPCGEQSYYTFSIWFMLPNLLFWVLFPIVIFLSFRRKVKSGGNLQFCTMKYKYGFFFMGFKRQYYFWEFIRIYFKISIVLLVTLLKETGIIIYVACIIMIFLYIIAVVIIQPFERKDLLNLEVLSYLILVPNIFFSQLSSQYNYDIFQLFILMSHFGFLIYTLSIIVQYKVNSQKKGFSRMLRIILKFILPKNVYALLTRNRFKNHFQAILRWRFVYLNLQNICQQDQSRLADTRIARTTQSNNSPVKVVKNLISQNNKMALSVSSEMMPMSSISLSPRISRIPSCEDLANKTKSLFNKQIHTGRILDEHSHLQNQKTPRSILNLLSFDQSQASIQNQE